ncbi:MAG: serine hydrolase [Oscillospiraceae bacterium]|nr:serine hydrolase [Oscillospiraceae bacterium]
MKKYKFLSLLLILLALTPLLTAPVRAAEGEQEQVQTTAETEEPWEIDPTGYRVDQLIDAPEYDAGCETALLLELNSGIVAYTKNAESNVYPASLTKIMTCLVALEYAGKDLDKMVTVSETALAGIEEAGGELRLKAGERMTLRDVLYYLMVSSDNEAGNVIAEYVAADIPSFVNLMNTTARELGCTHTHFANTHGLHDPNHYTTARDLSVITRKALSFETFREMCNTTQYTVPATNLSEPTKLVSTNYLLLNNGNRYLADDGHYYPYYRSDVSGIKTGYTSAAGRCVIARATDGNMDLMCIIMGAPTRMMSDGSVRYDSFVEAKKLFNYGFDNFAFAKVAAAGIDPMIQVSVDYAKDKRGVVLIPSTDVNCLLPKEYDKDKVATHYTLSDPKGLVAPLTQGQKVGTLYVTYDGKTVGSTDLETLTAVEERPVDKAIADITGKDTPEEEKSTLQKLLGYWYVPLLVIAGLVLILLLRNALYRRSRRKALERRRQRAILRDARTAERQHQTWQPQSAQNRQPQSGQPRQPQSGQPRQPQSGQTRRSRPIRSVSDGQTRRMPPVGRDERSGGGRGGRP